MSYTMFGREISEECSYLLLGVYNKGCYHCASYTKDEEGEFITSLLTGVRFDTLRDFVVSVKGLGMVNEWNECAFYDEENGIWFSLYYL